MICPECGGDTIVIESVRADHTVIRRRKCLSCGGTHYTEEFRVEKSRGWRAMEDIKRQRYPDRKRRGRGGGAADDNSTVSQSGDAARQAHKG